MIRVISTGALMSSLCLYSDMAVRIAEGQYRHPVCYVCEDCGLNLRMRGHFWAGDNLVCEKHARSRHNTNQRT